MSTRAQASGAVGAVINGRFRDLEEQRSLAFPVSLQFSHFELVLPYMKLTKKFQVFARDVGTAPPYASVKVVAVNEPVKLQTRDVDTMIYPGDYIVADLNGVVVLPQGLAEEVLPLMAKQVEADSKMAAEIKNGMTFVEASRKFR